MQQNGPSSDLGAETPEIPQGNDFEYDEAHDALTGPQGESPSPHRVDHPPKVNPYQGGDYGYDEAHDFD